MRFRTRTGLVAGCLVAAGLLALPAVAEDGVGAAEAWPGDAAVHTADEQDTFGENLSGLSFESQDVLWAVQNGPGTLYRLVPDGANWKPDEANGWAKGKTLHYTGGDGDADAEGVVATPDGIFAATERDNDDEDESKQEILRFDPAAQGDSLDAAGEWDLTPDLPESEANAGIEGISFIPDDYLTEHGFVDEHTKAPYDPATYAGHGSGLYLVGAEATGSVYAYALAQDGTYTRVATFETGLPAVMDLEFEPATGHLWATCDDTCDGKSTTLEIKDGAFTAAGAYDRPAEMPNYNNEGFAIAPQCADGKRSVLWSDDAADEGHALRGGTLSC